MKKKRVHLINPMTAIGGSEMRTLDLYGLLKETADITVWTESKPEHSLDRAIPIRRMRAWLGRFPLFGTLIFVGFYFRVGWWTYLSFARRRIIICNTLPPTLENFTRMHRRVSCAGLRAVEVAYAGAEVAKAIGQPGPILPSPIDMKRFRPGAARREGEFRVGRVSRDELIKHHDGAPDLYRRLVSAGCRVRVMGGTVLRKWIADPPAGLEMLPLGAEDSATFLRDLDCFLYRTSDEWFETFGRVVFEAMASGLPVVAHRRGGYAQFLKDGENALLFDTDEEAYHLVMRVKAEPELRQRLGQSARQRVEEMYSQTYVEETTRYFLGSPGTGTAAAQPQGLSRSRREDW